MEKQHQATKRVTEEDLLAGLEESRVSALITGDLQNDCWLSEKEYLAVVERAALLCKLDAVRAQPKDLALEQRALQAIDRQDASIEQKRGIPLSMVSDIASEHTNIPREYLERAIALNYPRMKDIESMLARYPASDSPEIILRQKMDDVKNARGERDNFLAHCHAELANAFNQTYSQARVYGKTLKWIRRVDTLIDDEYRLELQFVLPSVTRWSFKRWKFTNKKPLITISNGFGVSENYVTYHDPRAYLACSEVIAHLETTQKKLFNFNWQKYLDFEKALLH